MKLYLFLFLFLPIFGYSLENYTAVSRNNRVPLKLIGIDTLKSSRLQANKEHLLNAIHFRALDLLQFCAGVTYERYIVSERQMSLMFSYSHAFAQSFAFSESPDYIIAAGFRYQFKQFNEKINFFVMPEAVYSERSLSIIRHYSSPAGYVSAGAQYKHNRISFMGALGAGLAGTYYSYKPAVRIQANIGYAF